MLLTVLVQSIIHCPQPTPPAISQAHPDKPAPPLGALCVDFTRRRDEGF